MNNGGFGHWARVLLDLPLVGCMEQHRSVAQSIEMGVVDGSTIASESPFGKRLMRQYMQSRANDGADQPPERGFSRLSALCPSFGTQRIRPSVSVCLCLRGAGLFQGLRQLVAMILVVVVIVVRAESAQLKRRLC